MTAALVVLAIIASAFNAAAVARLTRRITILEIDHVRLLRRVSDLEAMLNEPR